MNKRNINEKKTPSVATRKLQTLTSIVNLPDEFKLCTNQVALKIKNPMDTEDVTKIYCEKCNIQNINFENRDKQLLIYINNNTSEIIQLSTVPIKSGAETMQEFPDYKNNLLQPNHDMLLIVDIYMRPDIIQLDMGNFLVTYQIRDVNEPCSYKIEKKIKKNHRKR